MASVDVGSKTRVNLDKFVQNWLPGQYTTSQSPRGHYKSSSQASGISEHKGNGRSPRVQSRCQGSDHSAEAPSLILMMVCRLVLKARASADTPAPSFRRSATCSSAQSKYGGRAIKGTFQRTIGENIGDRGRTLSETERTVGETDARLAGSTHIS